MMAVEPAGWRSTGHLAVSGGCLRYAVRGEGPVVVMLPKLGGRLEEWRHVALLLTGFTVIAIDPPGHGGSEMAGPPPHVQTVGESAAAIAAGLDSLGITRISVVGCSLGGCIGIAMAVFWPELVERLALVSVSLAGRTTLSDLARRHAADPSFGTDGQPLPRAAADLARFGPISDLVAAEQNASRLVAGPWLRPSERGVGRFGIAETLPRVRAPVLVVNGSDSHYRRYEPVAARSLPSVRFALVPESGPFVHQERSAETTRHLQDFLGGDAGRP